MKNVEIAIMLSRVVVHVLSDVPPPVPKRGAPLVSALTSRKFKPKWEYRRFEKLRMLQMEHVLCRANSDESGEEFSDEERRVAREISSMHPEEEELVVFFVSRVAFLRPIFKTTLQRAS